MNNPAGSEADRKEHEKLYVDIAIKNEMLTFDQIADARDIQFKIQELGINPKHLAEILVEKGYLELSQDEKIRKHIEKLRRATRIKGYTLLKKLGQGSMGTVYLATQDSLDRMVAVKVLAPFLNKNEHFVSRFIKEAKILARLNHPNIVQCIDVGKSENQYYLAMEFCDGPTVLEVLKRGGSMALERATLIALQIARALEHAYEHSIIHRDIKPDNIMMTPGGVAKLCDLGLVKDLGNSAGSTDEGSALGTPNYISPEQARGEENVDHRTDIYSLGASFYHMVTGRVPFESSNPAVVMVSHINDMPIAPKDRNPAIDNETSRIIMKMLRKNPADRHQSPTEILRELERLYAKRTGEPAPESDPVLQIRARKKRRR
ncbi:MAG: serine/threonine-protein kinase [Planctomycetota bacterium]